MGIKTRLLAAAAVSVMAAGALTGQAEAAPKARGSRISPSSAAAEVRELKAQVQALEARLAAQERAQGELQARLERAETSAAGAAADARDLQVQTSTQIETIPAKVKTAVAASKPKPGWEANTSVSGRMYFDLSHIDQERDGADASPSGTGFDLKRFYVGIDHKFNDTFSGNITTDVAYVSGEGLTQVYVKKAYLQAKVSDALTLRLGSADLPWVPFAEDVYGYRFVENTVADRDKFGTSADWGVHALGKLGRFNYAVAALNGAGYKNPSRAKGMDVEARISTTLSGVTVGVGGYSGKLGKEVQGGPAIYHTARRVDALAAYIQPRFRIGVEYFATQNWNNVTTVASDKADGYSLFGSVSVTPEVSLFGRYDRVRPSKHLNSGFQENYFNLGVNWEPVKIVDLALVYKRDKVDGGVLSTSNGTIGGVELGTYDEVGLFGQFRW